MVFLNLLLLQVIIFLEVTMAVPPGYSNIEGERYIASGQRKYPTYAKAGAENVEKFLETDPAFNKFPSSTDQKRSATNSQVFVKVIDEPLPKVPQHRVANVKFAVENPQGKTENVSTPSSQQHKRIYYRFVPVPIIYDQSDAPSSETFSDHNPDMQFPPGNYEEYFDDPYYQEVPERNPRINQKNPTINQKNPTFNQDIQQSLTSENNGTDLQESNKSVEEHEDLFSSEEVEDSDETNYETNVNQRIGFLAKDLASKSPQLSQNVKINSRISNNNNTNSSKDCIKHHIIQIININARDLEEKNPEDWYDSNNQTKSLDGDILINKYVNKSSFSQKDIVELLKKLLESEETVDKENTVYVKDQIEEKLIEKNLSNKEDVSRKLEVENNFDNGSSRVEAEERISTLTNDTQKQLEVQNIQEDLIQKSKRSSHPTLVQRDPYKYILHTQELSPHVEEMFMSKEEVKRTEPTGITTVQKIPRKRKFAQALPDLNDHLIRKKRNAPVYYNVVQSAYVGSRKGKNPKRAISRANNAFGTSTLASNISQNVFIQTNDDSESEPEDTSEVQIQPEVPVEIFSTTEQISTETPSEYYTVTTIESDSRNISAQSEESSDKSSYPLISEENLVLEEIDIQDPKNQNKELKILLPKFDESKGGKNYKSIFQTFYYNSKENKKDSDVGTPLVTNQIAQIFPSSRIVANGDISDLKQPYPFVVVYKDGNNTKINDK